MQINVILYDKVFCADNLIAYTVNVSGLGGLE